MSKLFTMKPLENGSPVINRIKEKFNNKPIWYRFKIKAQVQLDYIACIGVFTYLKRKLLTIINS